MTDRARSGSKESYQDLSSEGHEMCALHAMSVNSGTFDPERMEYHNPRISSSFETISPEVKMAEGPIVAGTPYERPEESGGN